MGSLLDGKGLITKISKSKKLFLPRIFAMGGTRREERLANVSFKLANHVPRALLSFSHARTEEKSSGVEIGAT